LVGDEIPNGGAGGLPPQSGPPLPFGSTIGTITFCTTIQISFENDFPACNPAINSGGTMTNIVTALEQLVSVADLKMLLGPAATDNTIRALARVLYSQIHLPRPRCKDVADFDTSVIYD
jgi:hypothetical protein